MKLRFLVHCLKTVSLDPKSSQLKGLTEMVEKNVDNLFMFLNLVIVLCSKKNVNIFDTH